MKNIMGRLKNYFPLAVFVILAMAVSFVMLYFISLRVIHIISLANERNNLYSQYSRIESLRTNYDDNLSLLVQLDEEKSSLENHIIPFERLPSAILNLDNLLSDNNLTKDRIIISTVTNISDITLDNFRSLNEYTLNLYAHGDYEDLMRFYSMLNNNYNYSYKINYFNILLSREMQINIDLELSIFVLK